MFANAFISSLGYLCSNSESLQSSSASQSCRVKSFNYKDFAFQFSSDELQYIIIYFFNF